MSNEIIKIDGLVINKGTVEEVRSELARKVIDGEVDAVKVMAAIKFYQKVFNGDDKKDNGLTHLIKDEVLTELGKDKIRQDWYGFKVEVKEAGAKYDYSNCNDKVYFDLIEEEKELSERIKARETFLKSIKESESILNEDTGEVTKIYPPVKKSTTSPTFTFSK